MVPVVLLCMGSDAVLILAGISGVGAAIEAAPWILVVARWAGAAFLLAYAFTAARRVMSNSSTLSTERGGSAGLWATLGTVAALTWLNPHVYLVTVLLLGSIAAHHGASGKWWFAVGAGLGSILWFTGLGYGARLAGPLLSRPRAWQVLDVLIGLTMLTIAVQLARG